MRVLVTRPEPGAGATAARLAAMGHEAILAPSLSIRPLAACLPDAAAALIITSGQAVPALPQGLCAVPVFCVGDATAGRLRAAGFARVESAAGDAEDLYRLIVARRIGGLHVMAVGERHGMSLARRLRSAGVNVLRRKVYAARPMSTIPAQAVAAMAAGEVAAALFYSAESARAFIRLSPPGTAGMTAYALSPAVATALGGLPWASIRVALAPSEADLMALLS